MRITLEADYAVRIVYCLAKEGKKTDAKTVAEAMCVSLRFALKILRKLGLAGLIQSYKGVGGGYVLAKAPADISIKDVVVAVDGPIRINKCLEEEFICARNADKKQCEFRPVWTESSRLLDEYLSSITYDQLLAANRK